MVDSKIRVADKSGFCFGVSRAVGKVNELLDKGESVYTLGPIIHNPQIIEELKKRGVKIVSDANMVKDDGILVIRSHGVPKSTIEQIKKQNIKYVDCTCPFVSKIQKIVCNYSAEGYDVLIAGDKDHPEVEGIRGNCIGRSFVFKSSHDLHKLMEDHAEFRDGKICVVAQTTFNMDEWGNCLKTIKKLCTNAIVFDTICNATLERQREAEKLSKNCDLMIVIGGRQSSNTSKLKDICSKNCKTFLIESTDELPVLLIKKAKLIGITAGASTPASIIKEALETMADILENKEVNETDNKEQNFETMLEESLKNFNTDDRVRGTVVGIAPNEIYVDVGRKQAGFIPLPELSSDPSAKPEDLVKIGDELDLLIMRTNDQEGTIMLSKRRLDSIKGWDDIIKAHDNHGILTGKVSDIIKGGMIVLSKGVRVFIPASLATASRSDSLDALKGKEVRFHVIEVNRNRKRVVGSVRSVINEEKKSLESKFWEDAKVDKTYTGFVKSLTSYGAFVDLGGVDGMIHISELSWGRIKHPSDVVNIGDTVEVYIKNINGEKGKISLGFKKREDNPWEVLKRDYKKGDIIEAAVVGLTPFGAFLRILPGVDGLVHISQIADHRIDKPQDAVKVGEVVKAMIIDIDFDKKRVSLSMREANNKDKENIDDTNKEDMTSNQAEEKTTE